MVTCMLANDLNDEQNKLPQSRHSGFFGQLFTVENLQLEPIAMLKLAAREVRSSRVVGSRNLEPVKRVRE